MNIPYFKARLSMVCFCALGILFTLFYRLYTLQVLDHQFLQREGNKRTLHSVPVMPLRGMILDRNGEPLAVSSPVKSLWVDPAEMDLSQPQWVTAAEWLEENPDQLLAKLNSKKNKRFLYLKRQLPPLTAKKFLDLNLKGLYAQTEYKRFYPMGEVFAQVIGTTDLDQKGNQGIELLYDTVLSGKSGKYRVLKDRYGEDVDDYQLVQKAEDGQNITLSIDSRIQYLAYKTLKQAIYDEKANAGSVVVLDVKTGEVLAMVNQPSFNPNSPIRLLDGRIRNRAVTDTLEPGSVMKAFSMVHILESGKYLPDTEVDTSPGWMKVGQHVVRDVRNFGRLTLSTIIQKSSNVGITKLTLKLPAQGIYETYKKVGFGEETASGFPGERFGILEPKKQNRPFDLATLAFGYGMTATPLQIVHAYATLADHGRKHPVSFIKQDGSAQSEQVINPSVANTVSTMLQLTTEIGGTATKARVRGYRVAGKTGTIRKVSQQGYMDNEHVAIFSGFLPADDPQIAMIVVVDNPSRGQYYAGVVAAPIFSTIAQGAMRILNIPQRDYNSGEYILAKS